MSERSIKGRFFTITISEESYPRITNSVIGAVVNIYPHARHYETPDLISTLTRMRDEVVEDINKLIKGVEE